MDNNEELKILEEEMKIKDSEKQEKYEKNEKREMTDGLNFLL